MRKVFWYECRRLLGNKVFGGLLVITAWYSWQVLSGEIVLGVANTAPFSPWSFGYYLSQLLPFLCVAELFFLTFFTSGKEARVRVLTGATPVDERQYRTLRCGVVLLGTFLLALFILALGMAFYARLFHWLSFGELMVPALFVLLPPVLFYLGVGWWVGSLHPALPYILMAAPFLSNYLPLPDMWKLSGGAFFMSYPKTLNTLDPAFSVPCPMLAGKIIFLLIGVVLLWRTVLPRKTSSALRA